MRLLDFGFVEEVIDETTHDEYGGRIPVGSKYIDLELQSPAMKPSQFYLACFVNPSPKTTGDHHCTTGA